jgi:integral membrane protein (TIGR01906 family)
VSSSIAARAASFLVAGATAVVILAAAILPFLTPAWIAFAQDRADAAAWSGYGPADLRTATDALLHDVVVGPPSFDVVVAGEPVLTERERAHLRDVRSVFLGLAALAAASLVVLAVALARARSTAWPWRSMRAGALGLVGAALLLGVVAAVAFDPAFEVFHQLFFAGGTYTFDPRTDRMVQLFPEQLWFETSIAVGVVLVAFALVVASLAGRRAGQRGPDGAPSPVAAPAPAGTEAAR